MKHISKLKNYAVKLSLEATTSWWSLMCFLTPLTVVNSLEQIKHWKSLTLSCTLLMCVFKLFLLQNVWEHWSHETRSNGFLNFLRLIISSDRDSMYSSPVSWPWSSLIWSLIARWESDSWLHNLHLYLLASWCSVWMCVLYSDCFTNTFSQISQVLSVSLKKLVLNKNK